MTVMRGTGIKSGVCLLVLGLLVVCSLLLQPAAAENDSGDVHLSRYYLPQILFLLLSLDDSGDDDLDTVINGSDNCPLIANLDQLDTDSDGWGDACDGDDDNDGVLDSSDDNPLNPQLCRDLDADRCNDCSVGTDGFGRLADFDVSNDGTDTDSDGVCNLSDMDDDQDTVADGSDNCPLLGNANQLDTDGDEQGDACDTDDDNDGVVDGADDSSLNPDICQDLDTDSCNDCSVGTDNFGPLGDFDVSNDGLDTDADGICDAGDSGGNGPPSGEFVLLAANDLGMHCADQDHQVFSILPPFNVVHAQLVQRGQSPVLMNDGSIDVVYLATHSATDPVAAGSINTSNDTMPGVFKTNFWDLLAGVSNPLSFQSGGKSVGGEVYDVLYPSVLAGILLDPSLDLSAECIDPATPAGCPSILNLFEPLSMDAGIPVPDGHALAAGHLAVTRQSMPGPANTPQKFERFDQSIGFFTAFDFGFTLAERNWWAADGIPISPVDDSGRVNAYPMMKVRAIDRTSDQPLAELDVVLPVAAEADCQNCHAYALDCADDRLPARVFSTSCNESGLQSMQEADIMSLDNAPGPTIEQQLFNAAKINILRLHDKKYGAIYTAADGSARVCDPGSDPGGHCLDTRRFIQCSQCHYSPALDLTQAGPVDESQQGANGRQQTRHRSMSNVIHSFHGELGQFEGEDLFPAMPSPAGRDPDIAENVLQKTCYSCHPGKNTDCLRGAMARGGVVCQDCHGDLQQVGNDFSLRVQSDNPGDFILDGSLRVPWATEPGCQSCHTGDARIKGHPAGARVADDGIRLLQSYVEEYLDIEGHAGQVKVATMNRSSGSRFAENQARNSGGDSVDVLYRLSKGHGGVACESCHNSTHAIWPTQNLLANDNVAAIQLQGHAGTIIECDTCHEGDLGVTLDGPHGLHPVGGGVFADGGHEELAEDRADECRSCHGEQGEGTVLSMVATNRSFMIGECEHGALCPGDEQKPFQVNLSRGTQVNCAMCHENKLR